MDDLDTLLKAAAEADWTHVQHRCAWCGHVAGRDGRYRALAVVQPGTVFTATVCALHVARAAWRSSAPVQTTAASR
jgi:hypothetical protein